jgi:hypothetical protein
MLRRFWQFLTISSRNFVITTSLSRLDCIYDDNKNLIIIMLCMKKVHSTSFFIYMTFGLNFLNIIPIPKDFLILAN